LKTKKYRKPPGSEAELEKRVRETCQLNGWKRKKMSSPGTKGTLDDYMLKDGRHVWIELKMPGNKPSPLQWQEIEDIRNHLGEAWWCNTLEQVCAILGNYPGYPDDHPDEFPPQEEWLI
jgi:hypothetical protein